LFDDRFLKDTGVTTLDFAKALIDEGFHPMTMYFPLVVHGALLIEPTETESKASLDQFALVLRGLAERAHHKRVKLELGNATPAIVCADAPADTAAKLAANAFSFAGQSCISVQRIFVLDDAWEGFIADFVPRVEALNVGDPGDESTDVGPVINAGERDRILGWIRDSNGEVLTGGTTNDDGLILPTVIANPAPADRVQCEEVFGPVVTVSRVATLDSAIEQANATRYGLQAAIFTRDLQTSLRAAQQLEFGGVIVNEAPTFRADQMPYGGIKDSGNTKEGPAWAVREMTEERLVVIQL